MVRVITMYLAELSTIVREIIHIYRDGNESQAEFNRI